MKTYWTAAMIGIQMSMIGSTRSRKSSISRPSGIRPQANPTTPAVVVATGRTSFGNAIWRISLSLLTTAFVASLMTAEYHFQGRIAAKMKSG